MSARLQTARGANRFLSHCVSIACGALLLAAVLGGCDRGEGTDAGGEPPGGSPSASVSPAATAARSPLDRLASDFAALRQRVNSPLDTAEKLRMAEGFLARARMVAAAEGKTPPEIEAAERLVGEIRAELDLEMKSAFDELEAQVMEILHSDSPEHQRAEALVKRFRGDRYPGTDVKKRLDELMQRIGMYQKAEVDYLNREKFIIRFGNDYAKKIGHLEGFDPDYDATPYGAKIRELIEQNYQLYVEARRAEVEALSEVESQRWRLNDYRWQGHPDFPIEYDRNEKVLSMGPNPDDYEDKDSIGSWVMFGDGTWIDVRITFEAKLEDPANVRFGAKGRVDRGRDTFLPISLAELELSDDPEKWLQFVVLVQRNSFEVSCVTTGTSAKSTHDLIGIAGDFVVHLIGSRSKLAMKTFEYSVYERDTSLIDIGDEPGDGEGEDGEGEGKGEDGDGER